MKKILLSVCVAMLCCAWGAKAQQSLRHDITPNFLVNYLVGLGVDSVFDKMECDPLDPQKCDSVYSYYVGPSRTTTNPPYQYHPKDNYVRLKTNVSLSMSDASAGINQGKTLDFGRNSASNYILYRGEVKDSAWIQKTGDYGPTLRSVAGPAKIAFKWRPSTASQDPGATEPINMIIYVIVGSDTIPADTALYANGTAERILSYTSEHSGNKDIRFYVGNTYKGNLIWYYIKVYDPSLGGYIIRSTPNIAGAGSVTRTPEKVGYDIGESVELTAVTNTGYNFLRWSDGNTNVTRSITIGAEDIELNPIYEAQEVQFTITATPAGYGTVTRDPEKSNNTYLVGESVVLTAAPSSIYEEFVSWSDGNTSATRTITIPNGNSDLTATFAKKQTFTVDIAIEPEGAGVVQKTPQRDVYFLGELIDIKAVPNQRYGFVKWEFDNETSPEHGFPPISDNISTKAIFELKEAQLTTTVLPNRNYGTLTITPTPPTNGIMEAYTDVVITANATDGNYFYAFVVNGSADSIKTNPLNINMDGDKDVRAIMKKGTPPEPTGVSKSVEYTYLQLDNVLYFQEPVSVKIISTIGATLREYKGVQDVSLQGLAQGNYLIFVEGDRGVGKAFWVQNK